MFYIRVAPFCTHYSLGRPKSLLQPKMLRKVSLNVLVESLFWFLPFNDTSLRLDLSLWSLFFLNITNLWILDCLLLFAWIEIVLFIWQIFLNLLDLTRNSLRAHCGWLLDMNVRYTFRSIWNKNLLIKMSLSSLVGVLVENIAHLLLRLSVLCGGGN